MTQTLHALFSRIPGVVPRRLRAGDTLTWAGDAVHKVWCVEHGGLALTRDEDTASSTILDVLGPNTCIGTEIISKQSVARPSRVWALLPTHLIEVPHERFVERVAVEADLALAVANAQAQQHADLLSRAAILREKNPLRRLAGMLFYLFDRLGEHCALAGGCHLDLNQHQLAAISDLSRQTVNRELNRLRRARFVHVERSFVCVLNPEGVRDVAAGGDLPIEKYPASTCKRRHPVLPLDCVLAAVPR